VKREDVVRELRTRHVLLTADGDFVDAAAVNLDELTVVQRFLLGRGKLPKAGVGTEIDRLLRDLRLGAPEPASDKGHFRFYPRGVLVRRLLRDWLERYVATSTGGVEVQTPTLFRWHEADNPLRELADSFGELLYHVSDDEGGSPAILRYGGDPGFFALMRDVTLQPDDFPFHVYELAESYRRHRTGEVSSILRARAMTFYDHHALCVDRAQARTEVRRVLRAQRAFLDTTGRPYDLQFVVVEDQLPQLRPLLTSVVRELGTNAYLTVLSAAKHYYSLVSNFCDPHGLHTLQIQLDHENPARFGLAGCPERYPDMSMLHMSSGAVERWLVSFLRDGIGHPRTAALPAWLAPTQVRVQPYASAHVAAAWQVRDELERAGVRADVDDRARSLRHRLAAAEREWVPWVAVVGDRELSSGSLDVLHRPDDKRVPLSVSELAAEVTAATAGYPSRGVVEPSVARRPRYA